MLDLSGSGGAEAPNGVDLTLRRGEILGIAGLVGAGRTELLRAIFGLDAVRSGRVAVDGVDAGRRDASATDRAGGRVPERGSQGGGARAGAVDRGQPDLFGARRVMRARLARPPAATGRGARGGWRRLRVKATGPAQAVGELSGGNQQKVALARLLHQEADVLLLDEPTRGIDVGSKAEIYRLIGTLAARGKAIIVVSSIFPSCSAICDRIAVMSRRASARRGRSRDGLNTRSWRRRRAEWKSNHKDTKNTKEAQRKQIE